MVYSKDLWPQQLRVVALGDLCLKSCLQHNLTHKSKQALTDLILLFAKVLSRMFSGCGAWRGNFSGGGNLFRFRVKQGDARSSQMGLELRPTAWCAQCRAYQVSSLGESLRQAMVEPARAHSSSQAHASS